MVLRGAKVRSRSNATAHQTYRPRGGRPTPRKICTKLAQLGSDYNSILDLYINRLDPTLISVYDMWKNPKMVMAHPKQNEALPYLFPSTSLLLQCRLNWLWLLIKHVYRSISHVHIQN